MDRHEAIQDAGLFDLIGRAEPGDQVVVVRDGREVGRVTVAERPDEDVPGDIGPMAESLKRFAALHASLPKWDVDGAALIREIRDAGY